MEDTAKQKVMMTISIDAESRQIIHKYARQRAVGQLISKLVRKYDYDMRYGPSKLETRLAKIEERILELLEKVDDAKSSTPTTALVHHTQYEKENHRM